MKQYSFSLPPEVVAALAAESKRSGAPKAELVRRAIIAYLALLGEK